MWGEKQGKEGREQEACNTPATGIPRWSTNPSPSLASPFLASWLRQPQAAVGPGAVKASPYRTILGHGSHRRAQKRSQGVKDQLKSRVTSRGKQKRRGKPKASNPQSP